MELQQKYYNVFNDISHSVTRFINNGGCIHFAYFVSRELTKRHISHQVIGVDYWGKPITPESVKMYGCSHVVVKMFDKYFDSDGIKSDTFLDQFKYTYEFPIEKLNSIRKNKLSWNTDYNRYYNATLSRKINNCFKKYDDTRLWL